MFFINRVMATREGTKLQQCFPKETFVILWEEVNNFWK